MKATAYDEVLYPGYTHPQTHPDRLAVIASLFGMSPRDVHSARVLEVGCNSGNNIIPMAWGLPQTEFIGIDLAETPVREGQMTIKELGLRNIQLACRDLTEVGLEFGTFDYVIAHGIYSWVPSPVREALLALLRQVLSPQGVAFVSYNALPGGHLRNMVREMMLMHVRGFDSPKQKVSQSIALLKLIADAQAVPDPCRMWLKHELQSVIEHEPGHVYHDELAEYNEPVYFTQFLARAGAHELQYLAEADFFEMFDFGFTAPVRTALAELGSNRPVKEQYLDFLKCRRFRQTLLCRKEVGLAAQPGWKTISQFAIASDAQREAGEANSTAKSIVAYQRPKGARCETDFALGKAALDILHSQWPIPLRYAELLRRAASRAGRALDNDSEEQFSGFLLNLYSAGMVEFRLHVPRATLEVSARPATSPVARLQAIRGSYATSLFHVAVKLEDEISRALLSWLDGTRDRAALLDELWRFLKEKGALDLANRTEAEARQELSKGLDQNLQKLGSLGLLMQAPPV